MAKNRTKRDLLMEYQVKLTSEYLEKEEVASVHQVKHYIMNNLSKEDMRFFLNNSRIEFGEKEGKLELATRLAKSMVQYSQGQFP